MVFAVPIIAPVVVSYIATGALPGTAVPVTAENPSTRLPSNGTLGGTPGAGATDTLDNAVVLVVPGVIRPARTGAGADGALDVAVVPVVPGVRPPARTTPVPLVAVLLSIKLVKPCA